MTATIYAMLACRSSNNYTQLAVDSFFKNTKLEKNDEFYLIDNDGIDVKSNANIIHNKTPQGFAKNSNDIINQANGRHVVILSNDVVFTPNWNTFLRQYNRAILIPSCNQTHQYSNDQLSLEPCMTIDQFNNNHKVLDNIADYHIKNSSPAFFEAPLMSFYVFHVPYEVYSTVGLLDERFGVGGGEDVDYRIRAILKGYSVKFTNKSFLLHFGGKSTWNGIENSNETDQRNQQYFEKFVEKWGLDLANMCLSGGDTMSVIQKYKLEKLVNTHNFSEVIKLVHNFSHS